MRDAEQLAPGACERVGGRVRRVPLGDDVVIGTSAGVNPGGTKFGVAGVARRRARCGPCRRTRSSRTRVEVEANEAALEPVVDRQRERCGDVRVDGRRVAAIDQVQEPAPIVGEAAAVGRSRTKFMRAQPDGFTSWSAGRMPRVSGSRTTSRISTASPRFSSGAGKRVGGDLRVDPAERKNTEDSDENDPLAHEFAPSVGRAFRRAIRKGFVRRLYQI